MPGLAFPPFPDNLPTHPLLVIDYGLLKTGDSQEIDKLWKAATELGFWYVKNHEADAEVEGMFEMGAETMDLPLDEKMIFTQGDDGKSFGYKALGTIATNERGRPDNVEFINISQEDALAFPKVVHRTYPSTVNTRMEATIAPFVRKSLVVIESILSVFEKKLSLPEGALLKLHSLENHTGAEARCIKSPPNHTDDRDKVALGAHTDFGSLSFLHNRLGGLQVLPPGNPVWHYIRPIPGHAICNIGDSLSLLSGGVLRSNIHRIVAPPGIQSAYTRWSVVFFSRPGNSVRLRALEESDVVKEVLSNMGAEDRARYNPNVTQEEWYIRRLKYTKIANSTGPETYFASRGTEYTINVNN